MSGKDKIFARDEPSKLENCGTFTDIRYNEDQKFCNLRPPLANFETDSAIFAYFSLWFKLKHNFER